MSNLVNFRIVRDSLTFSHTHEEQAKKVPKIFQINEIARSKIWGRSKTRKWENAEVSPKWVLERSYLEKYSP
jgi:hypothetical protein